MLIIVVYDSQEEKMKRICVIWLSIMLVFSSAFVMIDEIKDAKRENTKTIILDINPLYNINNGTRCDVTQAINITQLTDNNFDDSHPIISDNGQIAWRGIINGTTEIFFWNGTSIIRLTHNDYDDYLISPSNKNMINNKGQLVWKGGNPVTDDFEVFFWNGSNVIQLTNNTYHDGEPTINNTGSVVWNSYDGNDDEIMLWDGVNITQLTNNDYYDSLPQINENGHVAWEGNPPNPGGELDDYEIYFWDGTEIIELTNNTQHDMMPKINDNDQIVWESIISGLNYEIFFWNGTSTTQLTNDNYLNASPQINNNGQIVWRRRVDINGTEVNTIQFWDGSNITQLSDPQMDSFDPQINDNGQVVWFTSDVENWSVETCEIFFWDGGEPIQITDNNITDYNPQINELGQVVWYGGSLDEKEIYLLSSTDFSPPPAIWLSAPNGGEFYNGGGSRIINWTATAGGNPLLADPITIEYSSTGQDGPWTLIASSETNDGYYLWNPVPLINSTNCFVRVTVQDTGGLSAQDTSNASFEIDSEPPLPAANPNAELTGSNDVTIYWEASPSTDVACYNIYYVINGWDPTGNSYSLLGSSIGTSFTHSGAGNNSGTEYCYQVRACDRANNEARCFNPGGKIHETDFRLVHGGLGRLDHARFLPDSELICFRPQITRPGFRCAGFQQLERGRDIRRLGQY
jgi:hypothetical protein